MIEHRHYTNTAGSVDFFIGQEVEHSPAYGLQTLFVVGLKPIERISEILKDYPSIQHIYFGANQSFTLANDDADGWRSWEAMIDHFLVKDYLCTLDLSTDQITGLHDGFLAEKNRFIPMISVKLPYTRLFNYNTTVKIDDVGFESTNPGVWCWSLRDLMDRTRFTPWTDYKQDTAIEE